MSEPGGIALSPIERAIVLDILERHVPGRTVWAFGSRVTGKAKSWSDLDLAIIGDEALGLDTMADLREAFSRSDLPWKVDVVDWANTKDNFRAIITANGAPLRSVRPAPERSNLT